MSTDSHTRGLVGSAQNRLSALLRGPARIRWGLAVVVCLVYLTILATLTAGALPGTRDDSTHTSGLGCGPAEVTRTLATGSAWRMCVRIDDMKGLVLEKVQFRPATGDHEFAGWMPVIDSLYLAQLVVPYDTGGVAFNDVTDYGFGSAHLLPQTQQTCLGETLDVSQNQVVGSEYTRREMPGICLDEVGTGLSWHSREVSFREDANRYAQQGRALEVSSITKVSWYEYQQKVTLSDQGAVTVGLGATGDLAPSMFLNDPTTTWPIAPGHTHEDQSEDTDPRSGHSPSHWHNAMYRVDFGIGSGPQQVEQWDYRLPDASRPARVEGARTIHTQAFNADADPDPQTWWRVLNPTSLNPDGHARSYEIVNDSIQNPYDPLTRPKVSFTNNHACQEFASDNLNADCPRLSVPDYVAAETAPLTDPVGWVSVGFHHIARDEDQSPMPSHWQSFSLVPRDLLSQQATTPIERSCINGGPVSLYGSCAGVNLVAPGVTATRTPVSVGTELTSTTGTWRHGRSPLLYQRLWLRDGEPITSMDSAGLTRSHTGERYTVRGVDQGSRISVRVTAAAPGVIPGSATSNEISVPHEPRATSTAEQQTSVRLKVTVRGTAKRRLRVRVRGSGLVDGSITFQSKGWKKTRVVRGGIARVAVPKAWRTRSVRVRIRYSGGTRHLPAAASVWVRPAHRR